MRRLAEIFGVFICFLLQSTFFQAFSFAGVVPNLLIIITSVAGFAGGKKDGMITGFLCGILIDIFFGRILGLNALLYLYIGYLNGFGNRVFYPEDVKFPMIFITLSDLLCLFIQYVFGFLLKARLDLPFYFLNIMLPEMIYTIVVTIIVYRPIQLLVTNVISVRKARE